MTTTQTLLDFILQIIAGLITSGIFIYLLLKWVRPNIKIAKDICKHRDHFDDKLRVCYVFKIVNLSRFSAYDISAELSSTVSYPEKGGTNFRHFPLTLNRNKLDYIPRRPRWMGKKHGEHAILFRTYEDISAILADQRHSVNIWITLKHGLTGLSKAFNEEYVHESCIKIGHFPFGNNLNVG